MQGPYSMVLSCRSEDGVLALLRCDQKRVELKGDAV